MKVSIVTPKSTLLTCEARQVLVPGEKAPFAMLERHQAIISTLVPEGVVRIDTPGGESLRVRIAGSCIVEHHGEEVSILADTAEIEQ